MTNDFDLRVSVATLVRVIFTGAEENAPMLALERKATYHESLQCAVVKAQPFGGAVRINDIPRLEKVTGGFQFDSERSRSERDFRILIRAKAWEAVKAFCRDQFQSSDEAALETSPARELGEELFDSLGVQLHPDQYRCRPLWTVTEDDPSPTANWRAARQPTVRLYRIFEARILDPGLWRVIRANSAERSNDDLQQLAMQDWRGNGRGRANACIALPMVAVRRFYGEGRQMTFEANVAVEKRKYSWENMVHAIEEMAEARTR